MSNILINVAGWAGSFFLVAAYGLNTYQRIKSDSIIFYILNITGGIFLTVYSIFVHAYPNVFINVVWIIIAIPAFFKVLKRKN